MASPQKSQHDPNPMDPNATGGGDGQPGPDDGKDLSYLVPHVQVVWGDAPSFNADPPSSGSGDSVSTVAPSGAFHVDTGTLRAGESTMLSAVRTATDNYESLRSHVLAAKDSVWAPPPPPKTISSGTYSGTATANPTGGSTPVANPGDTPGNRQLIDIGTQFAAQINPVMEKALMQMGNALELTGQFIAMVNIAGQSYSQVDRSAAFPEPPAKPVVDS